MYTIGAWSTKTTKQLKNLGLQRVCVWFRNEITTVYHDQTNYPYHGDSDIKYKLNIKYISHLPPRLLHDSWDD